MAKTTYLDLVDFLLSLRAARNRHVDAPHSATPQPPLLALSQTSQREAVIVLPRKKKRPARRHREGNSLPVK